MDVVVVRSEYSALVTDEFLTCFAEIDEGTFMMDAVSV
jgi:hypothetical protein